MVCPCCAPGECDCPERCAYMMTSTGEGLTQSVSATAEPDECEGCTLPVTETDVEPNPLNEEDQPEFTANEIEASASVGVGAAFAGGFVELAEQYDVTEAFGYRYARSSTMSVDFVCRKVGDVATWLLNARFEYSESREQIGETTNPLVFTKTQSSSELGQVIELPIKVVCPSDPVTWTVVVENSGVTVNGVSYGWDAEASAPLVEECEELVDGEMVPCNDYLDDYGEPATFVLTRREACEFP